MSTEIVLPENVDIEQRRQRFEQGWTAPDVDRIALELRDATPEWADILFRELLFVEFEFTLRDDHELKLDRYLQAFPTFASICREVFNTVSGYTVFLNKKIGTYIVLGEIGRGGMGVVYKARHPLLHQIVALKVIKRDFLHDRTTVDRFMTEIKSMGRLSHPNIVRATDAGMTDDGSPYLVMELIDGINLVDWTLRSCPHETGSSKRIRNVYLIRCCEIIRDAARGIQAIHEAKLVHRDIKPGNLILQKDGTLKILDLGLAKLRQHLAEEPLGFQPQTRQGLFLGTPGYIAPEQVCSPSKVDIRADIYSLGSTFFYLLFGVSPTENKQEARTAPLPKKVRSILNRSLAGDPSARYAQPKEMANELDAFLKQEKRNRFRRVSAVLIVVLLLGLTGVAYWKGAVSERKKTFPIFAAGSSEWPGERISETTVVPVVSEQILDLGMLSQRPTKKTPPSIVELPAERRRRITAEIETALELRRVGEIDRAFVLLSALEKELRKEVETIRDLPIESNGFPEASTTFLPFVLSLLGDCDFFNGLASGTFSSGKMDRLSKWYREAASLLGASQPLLAAELECKRQILAAMENRPKGANPPSSAVDWTSIDERSLLLFRQLAEAIDRFTDDDQPLRRFVEQFEWSAEPELLTPKARELRLFALEYLIDNDRRARKTERLADDLQSLDRILFMPYQSEEDIVYLRRFFDLAIRCRPPEDFSRIVQYLLRLCPRQTGGRSPQVLDGATLVLFYFSPVRDVNGFVIYYPSDRQRARRFELPENRNRIKEAIEQDIALSLDEDLVSLIREDHQLGVPIILSWDDTSCWPSLPRRDSFHNEDWPFKKSISLDEILGQMK